MYYTMAAHTLFVEISHKTVPSPRLSHDLNHNQPQLPLSSPGGGILSGKKKRKKKRPRHWFILNLPSPPCLIAAFACPSSPSSAALPYACLSLCPSSASSKT